jgi:hypothetical protein
MRAPDSLPPEIERDLDAMDAAIAGRPHPHGDPLLAELAALVAERRPRLDPAGGRRLDAAFDASPRRAWARPLAALRLPSRFAAPALGLAACAAVAVVIGLSTTRGPDATLTTGGGTTPSNEIARQSGGGSGSGASSAAPDAAKKSPPPAAVTDQAAGGQSSPAFGMSPAPPPAGGDPRSDSRASRKVERSASMTLGARRAEIDAVADGVSRVATTLGGFVASSSVSTSTGGSLDLRVPSARLDDAIARLSRLAHVRRLERSTLDITAQSASARARIAELRAQRAGLLRQLARAVTLAETDRVRARLSTVNHALDAAGMRSRRIDNRAAYANVSVELVPERRAAAAAAGGWTPGDAWHDALRVLEYAAGIALVAFAVALPLVLVGAPAWVATRRLAQRRRERALDLA